MQGNKLPPLRLLKALRKGNKMTYFKKIVIANRGEIARRIIKTCQKLNISTVAVYSDADKDALFVKEADEAIYLGGSLAKDSYLDIGKIINAAKQTKADAIHPGYGFLAENANFSRICEEEGIVFIGPSAKIIELMGDKIEARKQMENAKVPIVPGWNGKLDSIEQALVKAEEIGYPIMLKASAGGGGIGMKMARTRDELANVFHAAQQQAQSFFGNGDMFLEKWIDNPRHIEVQIVCDQHGNALHLHERECSVQRNHQKVIEECPSPSLTNELREKLYESAIRGVRQIHYQNVGTMEFIVDEDDRFYFLEMNTRLQVEHPVTEEVTGVDIVELQIKIAAGEELDITQNHIKAKGHAIEFRLCAEDPFTFFPSPGVITKLSLPENLVRFDFAVAEGSEVSPFYDSMIGKVISYGENRQDALAIMQKAIEGIQLEGIKTNLPLVSKIAEDEQFQQGFYTTNLVSKLLNNEYLNH